MMRPHFWPIIFVGIFTPISPAVAADFRATAALIDKYIAAKWADVGAEPAPIADDAEFMRRVYLDVAGRIPSITEARTFLKKTEADKRLQLIDGLLAGKRYVPHFANVWSSLLLPEAATNLQTRFLEPGFKTWLRGKLAKNAGYDEMVRELLTAPIDRQSMQRVYDGGVQTNPFAYYLAKGATPENLGAATARVFLGIRLECAQCHDHPFASWKRGQFWAYAAFFAGIQRGMGGDFVQTSREALDKRELLIPGTDRVAQASFPDGTEPAWKFKDGPRITLANWMVAPENPYFARAAVNRMWFLFFGRGLVDPVDDMVGGDSTCSHPDLLDALAREFAASKFDLKFMIRAITASKAYQLTSMRTHESQDDPRLFARMPLRGLSPVQLFDSVAQATGYREDAPRDPYFSFRGTSSPREEFLSKFANQSDKPSEHTTSILQALALMNGRLVSAQTSLEQSETLLGIVDFPFTDTERIETLFLATLSRKPKPKELERALAFIESRKSKDKENGAKQALSDVLWTLLNLGEFYLNH